MDNDYVNLDVRLPDSVMKKLNSMTKAQLIERIAEVAIENKSAMNEVESMQTKLDKAEAYVEQGRAMINAVMERWYEYDV